MILGEPEEIREREENLDKDAVDEVAALKLALADARAKTELNLAGWQRAQADFANYKRRTEQDLADCGNQAKSDLILTLLPVLDDLERAFGALPEGASAGWLDGFRMIERKLKTALEALGLSAIKALGEPFDPRIHEATAQASGPEGMVISEMQKGYRFGDKIIRHSKVVVGNGRGSDDGGSESDNFVI